MKLLYKAIALFTALRFILRKKRELQIGRHHVHKYGDLKDRKTRARRK